MSCTLSKIVIFATGALIGSVVTWKLLDMRYEKIMHEECESIKTELKRLYEIEDEPVEKEEEPKKDVFEGHTTEELAQTDIREYAARLAECGYTDYANVSNTEKKGEDSVRPYIIEPDEYGMVEGYELCSFTYYADGVLADDVDDRIENVDEVIGDDSLTHFGEYEPDAVYVRNEERKTDYEILRVNENYSDVNDA